MKNCVELTQFAMREEMNGLMFGIPNSTQEVSIREKCRTFVRWAYKRVFHFLNQSKFVTQTGELSKFFQVYSF